MERKHALIFYLFNTCTNAFSITILEVKPQKSIIMYEKMYGVTGERNLKYFTNLKKTKKVEKYQNIECIGNDIGSWIFHNTIVTIFSLNQFS